MHIYKGTGILIMNPPPEKKILALFLNVLSAYFPENKKI